MTFEIHLYDYIYPFRTNTPVNVDIKNDHYGCEDGIHTSRNTQGGGRGWSFRDIEIHIYPLRPNSIANLGIHKKSQD